MILMFWSVVYQRSVYVRRFMDGALFMRIVLCKLCYTILGLKKFGLSS